MNYEFNKGLCEAVGLKAEDVQALTLRLRPGRFIEVTAEIAVFDGGQIETLVREYRFEAVPREGKS